MLPKIKNSLYIFLSLFGICLPVSVSPSLQNLEEMKICSADDLKQVFYSGEGDDIIVKSKIDDHASPVNVEKEMVLPNLERLILDRLPSIVYFSHGCCGFIFPCLSLLVVRRCPKLFTRFATTSNGSMSAQSEVLLI